MKLPVRGAGEEIDVDAADPAGAELDVTGALPACRPGLLAAPQAISVSATTRAAPSANTPAFGTPGGGDVADRVDAGEARLERGGSTGT